MKDLNKDLVIVPPILLQQLLFQSPDLPGHGCITKMTAMILTSFWTVGLSKEVEIYVGTCDVCQRRKVQPMRGALNPIHKSYVNEYVFFDSLTLSNNVSEW